MMEEIEEVMERLARMNSRQNTPRRIEDILAEADALVSKQNFPDCRRPVPVNFVPANRRPRTPRTPLTHAPTPRRDDDEIKKVDLFQLRSEITEPVSARYRGVDATEKRLNAALEELKDVKEMLRSAEVQQEMLVEDAKTAKERYMEQCRENRHFGAKLAEKDGHVARLTREVDQLRLENMKVGKSEASLKQQMAASKEEIKMMSEQMGRDKARMQDLQRQCKEMETVLMKRHPDSVSALIVASKGPALEANTKKLLEKRIGDLEKELKQQEETYKKNLSSVHEKVNSMKENYETHIQDLEHQVINLQTYNAKLQENRPQDSKESHSQTEFVFASVAVQTTPVRCSSAKSKAQTNGAVVANTPKKDSHLLATVRGMHSELVQKDKHILKLNKELEESKKSTIKIQRSKDGPANMVQVSRRICKKDDAPKISKTANENSTIILNSNKENKSKGNDDVIKRQFNNLQRDYNSLKKKRIDDLVELQSTHEKELQNLNLKIFPLQTNVDSLNSTVQQLNHQIKSMDKKLTSLVDERDHYKNQVKLNETTDLGAIKDGAKPGDSEYDSLKVKVAELERRYEGRELRLKTIIDSLAKMKNVHIDGTFSS